MDTSGDHLLDVEEFVEALMILGLGLRDDEARTLFDAVDVDASGEISKEEFLGIFKEMEMVEGPKPPRKGKRGMSWIGSM